MRSRVALPCAVATPGNNARCSRFSSTLLEKHHASRSHTVHPATPAIHRRDHHRRSVRQRNRRPADQIALGALPDARFPVRGFALFAGLLSRTWTTCDGTSHECHLRCLTGIRADRHGRIRAGETTDWGASSDEEVDSLPQSSTRGANDSQGLRASIMQITSCMVKKVPRARELLPNSSRSLASQ